MAMKDETRARHMRQLRRECICQSDDVLLRGVAYAIEQGIRRVTEDGIVGWGTLAELAREYTEALRR